MATGCKALFLDRDGVINKTLFRRGAQRAPQDLSEWQWMEGLHSTLRTLHDRGYLLVVVTNQPDVSRGWQTRAQVDTFHALIQQELPVAQVYACFHDNADGCSCRKPKPGMLLEASQKFGIALDKSLMIGDRQGDIDAGRAAGCQTVHFRPQGAPDVSGADHTISALPQLLSLAGLAPNLD